MRTSDESFDKESGSQGDSWDRQGPRGILSKDLVVAELEIVINWESPNDTPSRWLHTSREQNLNFPPWGRGSALKTVASETLPTLPSDLQFHFSEIMKTASGDEEGWGGCSGIQALCGQRWKGPVPKAPTFHKHYRLYYFARDWVWLLVSPHHARLSHLPNHTLTFFCQALCTFPQDRVIADKKKSVQIQICLC